MIKIFIIDHLGILCGSLHRQQAWTHSTFQKRERERERERISSVSTIIDQKENKFEEKWTRELYYSRAVSVDAFHSCRPFGQCMHLFARIRHRKWPLFELSNSGSSSKNYRKL